MGDFRTFEPVMSENAVAVIGQARHIIFTGKIICTRVAARRKIGPVISGTSLQPLGRIQPPLAASLDGFDLTV